MNIYERNSNVHNYNTRNSNNPRPPRHKSAYVNKSFLNKGPLLWSSLSIKIKDSKNCKVFMRNIKTHFIEKY